jgi:hypothetical protein
MRRHLHRPSISITKNKYKKDHRVMRLTRHTVIPHLSILRGKKIADDENIKDKNTE